MRRGGISTLVAVAVLMAVIAPPASAFRFLFQDGPQSATNGIAIGPDGNYWIAEEFTNNGSVVRMSPGGAVLNRFDVGTLPNTVTVGPGGRVWVAVTGTGKLAWFDATSAAPTAHFVTVSSAGSSCGPVGLAAGGDGYMYFSLPSNDDTGCFFASRVGRTADDGSGNLTASATGRGRARDLEVYDTKLFVPDVDGDSIRRYAPGGDFVLESTITTPAGAGPDGLIGSAGDIWVSETNSGNIARFPATQVGGAVAQQFTPPAGSLRNPFGIVIGADGYVYVTGRSSQNVARLTPSTGAFALYPLPNSDPYNVINGTDGDPRITDRKNTRVVRLVNGVPLTTTGPVAATGSTSAATSALVNPRGNDTQVVFDYGPTTAYGATSAPTTIPNGADAVAVTGVLAGLIPSTTYHVRARATSPEGTATGADATLTTAAGDADGDGSSPPADCNDRDKAIHPGAVDEPGDGIDQDCSGRDAPYPELVATANFTYRYFRTGTRVSKVEVSRLRGGETVTMRCKGRRCPFKARTFSKVGKGLRVFGAKVFKRRLLGVGAQLSVLVTKRANIGTSAVLTIRAGRPPLTARACLRPGVSRPSRCP